MLQTSCSFKISLSSVLFFFIFFFFISFFYFSFFYSSLLFPPSLPSTTTNTTILFPFLPHLPLPHQYNCSCFILSPTVLAGGVLTAYVGVVGLIKQLASDRCLPSVLLRTNKFAGTWYDVTWLFCSHETIQH